MTSDPLKIFIVEDDVIFAKIMSHHLSLNPEYNVEIYPDGRSLIKNLYKNPTLISLD